MVCIHNVNVWTTIADEIREGALEHWINHNYLVAQGIKKSVEWLDEEEEEEEKMDFWAANGGTLEFITCTLPEVMDGGHEEWGHLCDFVDRRK